MIFAPQLFLGTMVFGVLKLVGGEAGQGDTLIFFSLMYLNLLDPGS